MGLEILHDLHGEVRRLAVAGAGLAKEDFRLRRLVPVLQKAGAELPVFSRLADLTAALADPGTEEPGEKLLELASLLQAVLYTQGVVGCSGELVPLRLTPVTGPAGTGVSYRKLKPVITALTTRGPGRYEIIKAAQEEGLFRDLRLLLPALDALDDSFTELSELVFQILRGHGRGILPVLQAGFRRDGGRGDARKLELLSAILGAEGRDLYLDALENGSVAVRVAAVRALKDLPDAEGILRALLKDRKKEIREAAEDTLQKLKPLGMVIGAIGDFLKGKG